MEKGYRILFRAVLLGKDSLPNTGILTFKNRKEMMTGFVFPPSRGFGHPVKIPQTLLSV